MAKRDGTIVCVDFTLLVLNNNIISFSVQKQHNHQSHYKADAEVGEGKRKGAWRAVLLNLQTVPGIQHKHKNTHCSEVCVCVCVCVYIYIYIYIYKDITTV